MSELQNPRVLHCCSSFLVCVIVVSLFMLGYAGFVSFVSKVGSGINHLFLVTSEFSSIEEVMIGKSEALVFLM